MTELTPTAIEALMNSRGYNSVDQSRIVAKATAAGFNPGTAFMKFMSVFAGKHFNHPSFSTLDSEKMHFDIDALGTDFHPEATEEYRERLGLPLVPIGEAYNGHLLLMIDDNGALYGAYDRFFTKLGNDLEDGLNAIFERRQTLEIN